MPIRCSIVWRQGRSLPYGEGIGFLGLRRDREGTGRHPRERRGRGRRREGRCGCPRPPLRRDRARRGSSATSSPLSGVQQTRSVQAELATSCSPPGADSSSCSRRSQPVALVFEDLHWADDALLDFVDSLADRVTGVPLLVICSARPELLDRRPGWGGGKRNATTVSLVPLSDADTRAPACGAARYSGTRRRSAIRRSSRGPRATRSSQRSTRECLRAEPKLPRRLPRPCRGSLSLASMPSRARRRAPAARCRPREGVLDRRGLAPLSTSTWWLEEMLHALERKEFVRRSTVAVASFQRSSSSTRSCTIALTVRYLSPLHITSYPRTSPTPSRPLPPDRAVTVVRDPGPPPSGRPSVLACAGSTTRALVPRAARSLRESGDRAWRIGALSAALDFYTRVRELDPSVDVDPYFLLAIGLALATGDFTDAGADELERRPPRSRLRSSSSRPGERSRAASSSGRPATRRPRSSTSTGRERSSKARTCRARSSMSSRRPDVFWRSPGGMTRRASSSSSRSAWRKS